MPFTYRDKPKLADRLRGKSGEEILNELKSDLDNHGRRTLFDSPSWRTAHNFSAFPRGFAFDDDRNRINIRAYLDEIASRHPEFADQLKEQPWSENLSDSSFQGKSSDIETNPQSNEASGSSQAPTVQKEPPQNLTNFGFRNTVPLGPGANPEQDRYQRSMSAPPENCGAKKKFVTTCEIPIMNNPVQEPVQVKPELSGRIPQEPSQPKGNNAPNVRVIPIQVEGRDAPLVNTGIDTAGNFGGETFMEPSFEGRLPRDFGSYQRHSPRFAHKERAPTPPQYQYAPQYQYVQPPQHFVPPQQPFVQQQQHPQKHPGPSPMYQQHQQHPQKHPGPSPVYQQQQHHPQKHPGPSPVYQQQQQQHPPPPQQQRQQYQHEQHASKPPQGDEIDSKPPQPKPEPVKDPIEKVQAIQKDVEELMRQVEAFNGNSRTDKQYLMLDELLTRQLLLLDVIDTEGKENVRQARKDTIRSIQRCISTLENKVPVAENNDSVIDSNSNQNQEAESGGSQPMNVDKENTAEENKEPQKMEVDEQGTVESQPSVESQEAPTQQEQNQEQGKEQNQEKI